MEHVGQDGVFSLDQCSEIKGQGPFSAQRNSVVLFLTRQHTDRHKKGVGFIFIAQSGFLEFQVSNIHFRAQSARMQVIWGHPCGCVLFSSWFL